MNYVALFLPKKMMDGGIYGVAKCETLEENRRITEFAVEHDIEYITGDLHKPEELMEFARTSGMFPSLQ